jgi:hypothetical protein
MQHSIIERVANGELVYSQAPQEKPDSLLGMTNFIFWQQTLTHYKILEVDYDGFGDLAKYGGAIPFEKVELYKHTDGNTYARSNVKPVNEITGKYIDTKKCKCCASDYDVNSFDDYIMPNLCNGCSDALKRIVLSEKIRFEQI